MLKINSSELEDEIERIICKHVKPIIIEITKEICNSKYDELFNEIQPKEDLDYSFLCCKLEAEANVASRSLINQQYCEIPSNYSAYDMGPLAICLDKINDLIFKNLDISSITEYAVDEYVNNRIKNVN